MLARRPFADDTELKAAAREIWWTLDADDWREAFSAHPRIGDRAGLARRFPETHHHSAREQAGIGSASTDVLTALAERNREYYDRFGFIFIVSAAGKTADEMLRILESRLQNDVPTELRIAAAEQERITALRLDALTAV